MDDHWHFETLINTFMLHILNSVGMKMVQASTYAVPLFALAAITERVRTLMVFEQNDCFGELGLSVKLCVPNECKICERQFQGKREREREKKRIKQQRICN